MSDSSADRGTVVVLTALNLEYQAVRGYLDRPQMQPHHAGTLFEVGALPGTSWRIVLAVIGEGNQGAAVLAERAITLFHPAALLFVGVAGALMSDIELGDVVVATRIYSYHGGKEEGQEFLARPRAWDTSHHLDQLARHIARTGRWRPLLPERAGQRRFAVHFRPVAAGEVVLNSRTSPLAEQIRRHYNDAAAIEMESAGAAQAAQLNRALPIITIRGISDRADGGKYEADDAGWQPVAAAHAAAFAVALLTELPVGESDDLGVSAEPTTTPTGPSWTQTVVGRNSGTVYAVQKGNQYVYPD
jgi:nucleoside phosphorylase